MKSKRWQFSARDLSGRWSKDYKIDSKGSGAGFFVDAANDRFSDQVDQCSGKFLADLHAANV